jgi:hypothetical protein
MPAGGVCVEPGLNTRKIVQAKNVESVLDTRKDTGQEAVVAGTCMPAGDVGSVEPGLNTHAHFKQTAGDGTMNTRSHSK